MRFTIDTIQSGKDNDISALQLRKMYAGEIVKLNFFKDNEIVTFVSSPMGKLLNNG